MNDCIIPYKFNRLRKSFDKGATYTELAEAFLNSKGEGYFFDASKASQDIAGMKGETSFNPVRFKTSVTAAHDRAAVYSGNPYFSKNITDLYENALDSLSYMYNGLEQSLVKASFIDTDALTLTIDNSDLNANIQNYKNDLFEKVFKYVKKNKKAEYENIKYEALYEGKRFNTNSNYTKVLEDLSSIFEDSDYSPDVSIWKADQAAILDVYNAGVILSNFDSLVEQRFNGVLSVNQKNYNNLNNPMEIFPYFLEFSGAKTTYWKDNSHESEGIENYASNLLRVVASTIPLLDIDGEVIPHRYLGMNGISLVGTLVKSLNNELDLSEESFQMDPQGKLVPFLKTLRDKGNLSTKSKINSLISYMRKVKKLTKLKLKANPGLHGDLIDVEAVIAHQINNTTAPSYGVFTVGKSKKILSLSGRDLQGDEVKRQILDHIIQNRNLYKGVEIKGDEVVVEGQIINNISSKIDKDNVKLLRDLTGIDANPQFVSILNKTNNADAFGDNYLGASFATLLIAGKEILETIDTSGKLIPNNDELSKMLNETRIVDLIDSGIAVLSPEANMNLKSAEGNSIPTVKISNISHEKKTVFKLAEKHFGGLSSLFLKNPELYKGTETVLEVVKEGKAISALGLNPEESFVLSFVENYLKPMQMTKDQVAESGNYTSFKLVNYSDKSTILQELIDHDLDIEGLGSLREMPLNTLKKLHRNYLNTYYANLIEKIGGNYGKLVVSVDGKWKPAIPGLKKASVDGDYKSIINKINKFLKSKSKKEFKDIEKSTWHYLNGQNLENVTFTDEVSYSKYSDGLRFNKTIENYYFGTLEQVPEGYKSITDLSENLFLNKLLEVNPNIDDMSAVFNETDKVSVDILFSNMGLKLDDWVSFSDNEASSIVYFKYTNSEGNRISVNDLQNSGLTSVNDLKNVEVNPLVAKWLHTQNFIRYNSLALTTKHEYQHPHKTNKSYDMDFMDEMTGRTISMTKRMVIHPATMEYYQQGLVSGIPPTIKLALVDDMEALSYNFTGTKQGVDAWDGSLAANPFLSYLLKRSFPGKSISDVQKAIGTSSTDTHSTFLKCALFTFNNELIRMSGGSVVNLDRVMKSMNNISIDPELDISKNSINGNPVSLDQSVPDGVYYKDKGVEYKVDRFKKIDDENYEF